eukprot:Gb_25420 [translate_table: standard]
MPIPFSNKLPRLRPCDMVISSNAFFDTGCVSFFSVTRYSSESMKTASTLSTFAMPSSWNLGGL